MRRIFFLAFFFFSITSQANETSGVELQRIVLSSSSSICLEDLQQALEAKFAHEIIDIPLLDEMKQEVLHYFESIHKPFVLVDIPDQEMDQGELQIHISQSTLSQIRCQGNRYFSCRLLSRYIDLRPGEPIQTDTLLSNLAFINRNPFRTTSAVFSPGEQENTTDLTLVTEDRLPLRLYVGGDNTGNKYTGDARWFAGTTFFVWKDSLLSYQYTTSNDLNQFQAHTLHFLIPLPIHQFLIFYGGVSFVHPSLNRFQSDLKPPANSVHSRGSNGQISTRYEIPIFRTWEGRYQQIAIGFDYKHLNNDLEYIGDNTIPIFFKTLNLSQFMGGYTFAFNTAKQNFTLEAEFFYSPFQIFSNGSDTEFNIMRRGAKKHYVYGRLGIKETYFLPHRLSLYGYFRAQGASGALIPSEQLGLGGYDTVRGYDERIFDADNALISNLELHLPYFNFIKKRDKFYFLLFGDVAGGWNFRSLTNEKKTDWLASLGGGFRYHLDRYLQARLDWGFKLHKDSLIGSSMGKLHVGLIASY